MKSYSTSPIVNFFVDEIEELKEDIEYKFFTNELFEKFNQWKQKTHTVFNGGQTKFSHELKNLLKLDEIKSIRKEIGFNQEKMRKRGVTFTVQELKKGINEYSNSKIIE